VGGVHSWSYDTLGRTTSETDEASRTTQTAYDAASRVTSVKDPLLNVTSYLYDDSRLTRVTSPDPDGAGALGAPYVVYTYLCTCQPPNHKKTQLFGISSLTSCSA
jgi:YD repeat-containing protein